MGTIYQVWLSTDGCYYALPAPRGGSAVAYDVLEGEGPGVWLHQRYVPTGWDDTDKRYTHAEFPGMIGSWTNEGRWTRGRTRYIEGFSMTFLDLRQDIQIHPWASRPADAPYASHVLATYVATFRTQRRVTPKTWQAIQARIAEAITEGHRRLWATGGVAVPERVLSKHPC